ncbi:rhodanese-like domain-containing protein [Halopenitus persicus]|uniref:rhodanese-like domain-containing protein n=1 Tax=Halopenitus persicus TaxID=1048396 RepID=UPI000BBA4784|nr:rhodanese-like domain-containing protein [Halopenitus persicus]
MSAEIEVDELAALLETVTDTPASNVTTADTNDDADGESLVVVDVRSKRAFDRGHIPGSRNVPFPELTSRVEELAGADRIVTVCPHGIASQQAADLITSYAGTADATVESLRGGLEAWDGPLEGTSSGSDSTDGEASGSGSTDEGPEAPF